MARARMAGRDEQAALAATETRFMVVREMLNKLAAAIVAGCALIGQERADAFTDMADAAKASAILASVTVCKAPVSPETRRTLYAILLNKWHTPSQVNFMIDEEISALNAMPASERSAMCLALGQQGLSEQHEPPNASFRVVTNPGQASCAEDEMMVSALCAGGAALRIDGTTGAACDGGAKAIIVCARQ
jgi:hypothetical protein